MNMKLTNALANSNLSLCSIICSDNALLLLQQTRSDITELVISRIERLRSSFDEYNEDNSLQSEVLILTFACETNEHELSL